MSAEPPWTVIHTTTLISHKAISNLLPFPCRLILSAAWSGLSPSAFYSTLRDCTQSKEFLLLPTFFFSLSFAFYYFCRLSILLHSPSLSAFLRGCLLVSYCIIFNPICLVLVRTYMPPSFPSTQACPFLYRII